MSRMLEALQRIGANLPPSQASGGRESPDAAAPPASPVQSASDDGIEPLSMTGGLQCSAVIEAEMLAVHGSGECQWTIPESQITSTGGVKTSDLHLLSPSPRPRPAKRAAIPRKVRAVDPQFEQLAGRIMSGSDPKRPAALLVTGLRGRSGPSHVVAGLAVALAAQIPGEVLLVDSDWERPSLAELFAVPPKPRANLLDVIGGSTDWRKAIRRTGIKRLSLLPAHKSAGGDGEMAVAMQVVALLDAWRREHQFVLLSGMPLDRSATAVLARHCDGTFVVLPLGHTGRREAQNALRSLQDAGARGLGCILIGQEGEIP